MDYGDQTIKAGTYFFFQFQIDEDDYCSQFLISRDSISQNRAEASKEKVHLLNPMVELIVLSDSLESKANDFFIKFDLVILLDQHYQTVVQVNKICRKFKIRFQAGGVYGCIGYAFFDFNNYSFLIAKSSESKSETIIENLDLDEESEPAKKKIHSDNGTHQIVTLDTDEDKKINKNVRFLSFEQTINVDMSSKRFIRRRFVIPSAYYIIRALLRMDKNSYTTEELAQQWKKELKESCQSEPTQTITESDLKYFVGKALNPVCAITGSVIGQEAIKALSQNDLPFKNIFVYSAIEGAGFVLDLDI